MATSFTSVLSGVTLGGNVPQKIFSDVKNSYNEILILCGIAAGIALLVVILMQFLAAVIVWTLVFMVVVLCLGATAYSWLAIVLLVLLVLRSRIALVIQLFKEAGSALRKMPLLLLQPIWTLAITLASAAGLILIATFIETSGLPVKNSDGHVKYVMEALWTYLRWYHYFGILWITAFILACQDLVVAGAVAIWYFKRDKSKLGCPICRSTQRLIRYHLGSVAFGSFIIALVRFVRLVLAYIQNKLKGRTSKIVDLMLKMLQCCLWCFEKFLQYINRNAYIEIAIYGKSFCESARKAFILIVNNALRVVAINSVGDFVLFIGKLCTVGVVLVVGHELLKNRDDINYIWAPISIACAFAFAISHCFMVVYEIAIDTIFICFCEDCERNDGVTKPFFMSKNLMEFLDSSAKAEMKKKSSEKKSNKAANV
ncbi:hypothetical protein ACJMK2_042370 [Sinanodonta woodiana]|uniref:Choline transporter-like protein n=1 Tax=Sinanodonta woodiana TaxID=1069815 RepID=A0ABD3W744_SINWO